MCSTSLSVPVLRWAGSDAARAMVSLRTTLAAAVPPATLRKRRRSMLVTGHSWSREMVRDSVGRPAEFPGELRWPVGEPLPSARRQTFAPHGPRPTTRSATSLRRVDTGELDQSALLLDQLT